MSIVGFGDGKCVAEVKEDTQSNACTLGYSDMDIDTRADGCNIRAATAKNL